jgi:hypothetical protein
MSRRKVTYTSLEYTDGRNCRYCVMQATLRNAEGPIERQWINGQTAKPIAHVWGPSVAKFDSLGCSTHFEKPGFPAYQWPRPKDWPDVIPFDPHFPEPAKGWAA